MSLYPMPNCKQYDLVDLPVQAHLGNATAMASIHICYPSETTSQSCTKTHVVRKPAYTINRQITLFHKERDAPSPHNESNIHW